MTVTQKVTAHRLEWLGHLACMPKYRIPQKCLFGWLPEPRPRGGPTRRWRDGIRADLKIMYIPESEWYENAHGLRMEWRTTCWEALAEAVATQTSCRAPRPSAQVSCQVCGRSFRREGDMKRHKCTAERQKPVSQQ